MIFDLPFNFWGNSVKVSFEEKKSLLIFLSHSIQATVKITDLLLLGHVSFEFCRGEGEGDKREKGGKYAQYLLLSV